MNNRKQYQPFIDVPSGIGDNTIKRLKMKVEENINDLLFQDLDMEDYVHLNLTYCSKFVQDWLQRP